MDKTRRLLDHVIPQSAFGLTLLTIAVLIVIVAFFVRGIHLVSIHGEPAPGSSPLADRALLPSSNRSIRLESGDSYSTGVTKEATPSLNGDSIARVEPKPAARVQPKSASQTEPKPAAAAAAGAPVDPSQRYAGNIAVRTNVAPGYVAALTRTCECRWAENSPKPKEGSQFKVGQTLNIAAGLVEIVFGCGARAILEGPAILEIQSSKSGALQVGKLTADVPDEVEGFTVHTPVACVVSLCSSQPKGVAKLTSTADCLWAEGNAVSKEGACLLPGQVIKLIGGLAEITFISGAKVILQGPANLEIESAKSATLHGGRMTADVPDELEGFRIRTSVVEILSLPAVTPQAKEPPAKNGK